MDLSTFVARSSSMEDIMSYFRLHFSDVKSDNYFLRELYDFLQKNLSRIIVAAFFLFPILWIICISLQPENNAYNGHYLLIPKRITIQTFIDIILNDKKNIRTALLYSFKICSISTLVVMVLALLSHYVIRVESLSRKWKSIFISTSVGLFFLPTFLIFPSFRFISQVFSLTDNIDLQLFIIYTLQGYSVAFLLLLFFYSAARNDFFEQLLLETGSRLKAFYLGVIIPQIKNTIIVAGITFTTIWSEFFLSGLITSSQPNKPFSVILQMAQGQYSTEYTVFAAGAVLSFIAYFVFSFLLFLTYLLSKSITSVKGKSQI